MVIERLKDATVFLDSAPLIYFIEGQSEYQNQLIKLFEYNDDAYFHFITSSITLLEVLVKPMKEGQTKVANQYRTILMNASGIEIFDITTQIAVKAAEIRAKYNFRTPDSIQIATAIERKANFFLTNDHRIKTITEIEVLLLKDFS